MDEPSEVASARVEIRDELPGDIRVFPIEASAGEWVWLVRRGEMTEEAVAEVNRLLAHVTGSGLWTPARTSEEPTGHCRQAI